MSNVPELYDIDAERAVLGGILVNEKYTIPRVVGVLSGMIDDCFYQSRHQMIFNACMALSESKTPIDAITLQDRLEIAGTLGESGGFAYIADLTNAVPTSANVEHYAEIVEEYARKRKIMSVLGSAMAGIGGAKADEISTTVRQGLIACEPSKRNGLTRIDSYLDGVVEELESYLDPDFESSNVRTGIKSLDDILVALGRDELVVIAARTSVGKSAVALNVAVNVSRGQGIPVLLFSLEMGTQACLERVMQMVGEVDIHKYRRGASGNGELAGIGEAAKMVKGINLWINDTDRIHLDEMLSVIRLHIENEGNPGLIVVDYLQLVSLGGGYKNIDIRQRITIVTGALKSMAREFQCPVICISQINRAGEDEPKLSNLAESGSIENDADKVILVSPISKDKKSLDFKEKLLFDVAKNRNGITGKCEVLFVKAHQLVKSIDVRHTALPEYSEPVEYEETDEMF